MLKVGGGGLRSWDLLGETSLGDYLPCDEADEMVRRRVWALSGVLVGAEDG